MSDKKKRSHRKKHRMRAYEKRALLMMTLVVSAVGVTLLVRGSSLRQEIRQNSLKETSLEEQLEEETTRTQEIQDLENYMQTDEYIEKIAREKLGLLKENEILFREN